MPYSEDDTFRSLKRIPYLEMKAIIDTIVWDVNITQSDFENIFKINGWTADDYDREYLKRR